MARTAPIPNFPAIPGMNPGIFILGGGGDGGGAGGGRGKGGAGKQGAGGSNGGNDADGGGAGASGCGPGSPGTCTQCGKHVAAGHPVDVVTGRAFTETAIDLSLRGPLPLEIRRSYSSTSRDHDVGMGHGWCHSMAWRLLVRRRHVDVHSGDGKVVRFDAADDGQMVSVEGWLLTRSPSGFVLDANDDLVRYFEEPANEGAQYLLTAVEDQNENRIRLVYDQARLQEIIDSAGRTIKVTHDVRGHIHRISVKNAAAQGRWIDFATYHYDAADNLTSVTDADGFVWQYAYDEDYLLVRETDPAGLSFHFVYDDRHRCIETWGDYGPTPDPALSASVPTLLADGRTKAKGIHHVRFEYHPDGYSEVIDSKRVRRFVGNAFGSVDMGVDGGGVTTRTYDVHGNPLSRTDPMGGVTMYTWDTRGRLLSVTDPVGRSITLERDSAGRLVGAADAAGNEWKIHRDRRGNIEMIVNPRGAVWRYARDPRGLRATEVFPTGHARSFT